MGLFSSRNRDEPKRSGRIVTIPSGRALVISDLHGHLGDFEAFLSASRAVERIKGGEDLWVLITGDVPDLTRHRLLDPDVPVDGDIRILDRLIGLKKELGPKAGRIVYLEGNHDFHILRIIRELGLHLASRRGGRAPAAEKWDDPIDRRGLQDYFAHYKRSFGEEVFENNITPYDMCNRVEPRHLAFLAEGPILAVLEGAGALVTHAGPPRMKGHSARSLRKTIERSTREDLRQSPADAYYASPYHQLLNGRFRSRDYDLEDVDAFVKAFDGSLLLTGHTPHAYLVDYALGAPLVGCAFKHGLGLVGERQVVLCTSFGAFDKSRKRYLELDLSRRYDGHKDLHENVEIKSLYPDAPLPPDRDETTTILKAISAQVVAEERERLKQQAQAQRPTRQYDPRAITEAD